METNVAVPYNGTSYTTNITTLTTYIGGFVYQSKTYSIASLAPINEAEALQLFSHEEGRVRFKPAVGTAPATFAFDYFIKDHLGNVRMVITDEQQTDIYPVASLEPSKLATEKNYYDIKDAQISLSSAATGITSYTNDNGIGNNPPDATFSAASSTKLYRLNSNEAKTGLGITLKVMAGDKIDVFGKSYYFQNTTGTSSNSTLPVLDLLTAFLNAPAAAASTAVHGLVTPAIINTPTGTSAINTMMGIQNTQSNATPTKPRAFINVIFFDEQFKAVSYQISMAGSNSIVKDHHAELQNIVVPKNGFVYIYCSNESPVNVFFDNMQVVQTRGPILEETHYYPFGLTMAGISSKAAGKLENKYGITGKEKQSKEFSDGSGLEAYDFGARFYDQQIGRFSTVDPHVANYYWMSPYSYCNNNPLKYLDPSGMDPETSTAEKPKDLANVIIKTPKKEDNSLANRGMHWANSAASPAARHQMNQQDTYQQARGNGFSQAQLTKSWSKLGVNDGELDRFERGYQAEVDSKQLQLVFVGAIGAPVLAIGGIEAVGVISAASTELSSTALLESYTTTALKAITSPGGSSTLMRGVLDQGLSLVESEAAGVSQTMLEAYRVMAYNKLAQYVTADISAVGQATQIQRIIEITKMLGF